MPPKTPPAGLERRWGNIRMESPGRDAYTWYGEKRPANQNRCNSVTQNCCQERKASRRSEKLLREFSKCVRRHRATEVFLLAFCLKRERYFCHRMNKKILYSNRCIRYTEYNRRPLKSSKGAGQMKQNKWLLLAPTEVGVSLASTYFQIPL